MVRQLSKLLLHSKTSSPLSKKLKKKSTRDIFEREKASVGQTPTQPPQSIQSLGVKR